MLRDGRDVVFESDDGTGRATEGTLELRSNLFASLLKFEAQVGEELRADDVIGGDRFHGRAVAGAATSAGTWEVVRFTRNAQAAITRVQYKANIAWDDRANAAHW